MVICNNPGMLKNGSPSACEKNKICCCRHCDEAEECLKPLNYENHEYLCPYVLTAKDLEYECPFEKNLDSKK